MAVVEEQGYVIVATNTEQTNYVESAVQLADSLKYFHPAASVCLITDVEYNNDIFNHIKLLPATNKENPWANDWQAFKLSPYRETVKLEADMIIASPVDHWWPLFRNRDVVVSTGCRDWKDTISNSRYYRRVFDENNLPDVYNAITYWRLSTTANDFFKLVRQIFDNWNDFKKILKFPDEVPSTDLVYAVASQIIGPELCTLPADLSPKIVHMKQHIAGTKTNKWTQDLVWEKDPFRINTIAQWGAVHYHCKDWRP